MNEQVQGFRIQGTQTYVCFDEIVEEFQNGNSIFDLSELYGESEKAIEDVVRKSIDAGIAVAVAEERKRVEAVRELAESWAKCKPVQGEGQIASFGIFNQVGNHILELLRESSPPSEGENNEG